MAYMQHETLHGAPFTGNTLSAGVCSHGLYRGACKAGGTPEAVLDVSLGDLGRAPALALLGSWRQCLTLKVLSCRIEEVVSCRQGFGGKFSQDQGPTCTHRLAWCSTSRFELAAVLAANQFILHASLSRK